MFETTPGVFPILAVTMSRNDSRPSMNQPHQKIIPVERMWMIASPFPLSLGFLAKSQGRRKLNVLEASPGCTPYISCLPYPEITAVHR